MTVPSKQRRNARKHRRQKSGRRFVPFLQRAPKALLAYLDRVSILPEILEPIRRHLGVSNRVHDILVAHVVLEGPGIMPIVGELVPDRVPEHVGVDWKRKSCRFLCPGNRFQESRGCRGTTPFGDENVSRFHILAA